MAKKKKPGLFDHVLVPVHEIVPEDEVQQILAKWNITKENLPKILKTDPAVQEIGAKPGDVIRIYRESPTAGKTVYYRVVV